MRLTGALSCLRLLAELASLLLWRRERPLRVLLLLVVLAGLTIGTGAAAIARLLLGNLHLRQLSQLRLREARLALLPETRVPLLLPKRIDLLLLRVVPATAAWEVLHLHVGRERRMLHIRHHRCRTAQLGSDHVDRVTGRRADAGLSTWAGGACLSRTSCAGLLASLGTRLPRWPCCRRGLGGVLYSRLCKVGQDLPVGLEQLLHSGLVPEPDRGVSAAQYPPHVQTHMFVAWVKACAGIGMFRRLNSAISWRR